VVNLNKLNILQYKHILVLGLARSGTAVAKVLLQYGKKVRINDLKTPDGHTIAQLKGMGADIIIGSHPLSVLDQIELVIKNPGIPYDHPIVREACRRDIPIITEIELAGQLTQAPIIGITGSNGKTTTTTLVTEMLAMSNQRVKVAGNIGIVATDVAKNIESEEKLVLELSSFQLLGIKTFKPHIAVLLNIYDAHLDYHKTLDNYIKAKSNIFSKQTIEDYLVYNADDERTAQVIKRAKSNLIPFSRKRALSTGAWADLTSVYYCEEKIIDRADIALVGEHNLENILAAISVAKLNGATTESIVNTLKSFTGVKHRLQFIKQINGRLFYNDSKATNVLATQKALSSFNEPTILLAGGLDRGHTFNDLLPYLTHVRAMIVFGQTAPKLENLAKVANIPVVTVNDVKEATLAAYKKSNSGDVILLSPACASWDQYQTFEERGNMFIKAVHTLS